MNGILAEKEPFVAQLFFIFCLYPSPDGLFTLPTHLNWRIGRWIPIKQISFKIWNMAGSWFFNFFRKVELKCWIYQGLKCRLIRFSFLFRLPIFQKNLLKIGHFSFLCFGPGTVFHFFKRTVSSEVVKDQRGSYRKYLFCPYEHFGLTRNGKFERQEHKDSTFRVCS